MNEFVPVTAEDIATLREQAKEPGLSRSQVHMLIRELDRTENERARLHREVETLRAGRVAMRETFVSELHDKTTRITELESQLQVAHTLIDGAVA